MVITEMRQCKAKIIEEFRMCGERREEIAKEYEGLMDYDGRVGEVVN